MSDRLPLWALWIQWGGTIALAIGAFGVAYGQWKTSRQKLILDLMDKRFAIYRRVSNSIVWCRRQGKLSDDQRADFYKAVVAAEFLFGEEVSEYLKRVDGALEDLIAAKSEERDLSVIKVDAIQASRAASDNLEKVSRELTSKFGPYISLTEKL